jgi:hypothetical protein
LAALDVFRFVALLDAFRVVAVLVIFLIVVLAARTVTWIVASAQTRYQHRRYRRV